LCGVFSSVYDVGGWYRVTKSWRLKGPALLFDVSLKILRDGWFSEPAVRFKFPLGFARWRKYGTPWTGGPKVYVERDFPPLSGEQWQTWDELNQFVPDWVEFAGNGTVRVTQSGAGLAQPDFAMEQNEGQTLSYDGAPLGEFAMAWMEWWGGNPPAPDRYRPMAAGTAWSRNYLVEASA
ncbi:MAG: hypothetical protein JRN42_07010, partial [Nitrososphaerota archaeon]|nr:hypothetical protein [Nitrososphaerota archaeon]